MWNLDKLKLCLNKPIYKTFIEEENKNLKWVEVLPRAIICSYI